MNARRRVYLGVDVGTSSAKAVLLSSEGTIEACAAAPIGLQRRPGGGVEQDMKEVLAAAVSAIRSALQSDPSAHVCAVGISGQGDGLWLVDRDGHPVAPAAIWMDGRASTIVEEWRVDGRADEIERVNGSRLFSGSALPLAEWYRRHHPELLKRAYRHCNAKDWIGLALTGTFMTDPSEAARIALPLSRWAAHEAPLEYDYEFVDRIGLSELAELLSPIAIADSVRGVVTSAASASTGLEPGTPVIVGLLDGVASSWGMGARADGSGFAILGTTASYGVLTTRSPRDGDIQGICVPGVERGLFNSTFAPATGAGVFEWARATLSEASTLGEFEEIASSAPVGSNGVTFMPHLSTGGERAPFVSTHARGTITGLTFSSSQADLARSVYEGVAFLLSDCFDVLPPIASLRLGGGGAASHLLPQIIADAIGIPVHAVAEAGSGAAAVASLAASTSGEEIRLSDDATVYTPNGSLRKEYRAARGRDARFRQLVIENWQRVNHTQY